MKRLHLPKKTRDNIFIVCISFILAMVVGGILLVCQGENPFTVYYYLIIEPLLSTSSLIKVLGKATPLIFTGLAATLAFRCNIFNIGIEGQLYAGALVAAVLGYSLNGLPGWLHLLLCIGGGALGGALCAFIPAWLKVKLNVHEVISTIMLNYIISNVVSMLVNNFFRDAGPTPRTPYVHEAVRFAKLRVSEHLNVGILIAIVLCFVVYIIFSKTAFGYRVDAAGKNLEAARYSGINSNRIIIVAMMLSGMVAALAGIERVLGAYGYMELNFSPGYGATGLAIGIIARKHPIGVLLVAFLMGVMSYGGVNINIMTQVATEWVEVLIGLVFAFVVIGDAFLKRNGGVLFSKQAHHKEALV